MICSWNAWKERTWLRATVTHKIKQEESADLSIIIIAYPWIMQSDIKCCITVLLQCTPSNILQPALVRPDSWAIHDTVLLEHRATDICWEPTSCQELYIISLNLLDALWASVTCRALSSCLWKTRRCWKNEQLQYEQAQHMVPVVLWWLSFKFRVTWLHVQCRTVLLCWVSRETTYFFFKWMRFRLLSGYQAIVHMAKKYMKDA